TLSCKIRAAHAAQRSKWAASGRLLRCAACAAQSCDLLHLQRITSRGTSRIGGHNNPIPTLVGGGEDNSSIGIATAIIVLRQQVSSSVFQNQIVIPGRNQVNHIFGVRLHVEGMNDVEMVRTMAREGIATRENALHLKDFLIRVRINLRESGL